ncbi:hypothetical protein BGX26_001771 [Mortierella sp. AD094]|nr:hypothetical protein BGX26_001771 [Mortierella sp. AD094]
MSLLDDDSQDQLTETLQQTRLTNSSDNQITTTDTKTATSITDAEMNSVKSSDEQEEEANGHDKDKNSDEYRIEDSSNKDSSSISFVTPLEATSGSKDSAQMSRLERRKSSLSTTGSRLKRSQSAEKHVTIVDSEATKGHVEQTSDVKAQEDEATKEELSKILMQFDPLVESNQKKAGEEEEAIVTITDRGLFSSDTRLSAESAAISPSLTPSPQMLDSPRTSHDVQVALSEKTKSSSSKKKSESRQKSSQSQDSSRNGDKGSVASNSANASRSEPPKPKDIPFDFHKFLEQMGHRSAIPITRYFRSFLKEFERKPWTVNEQIKIIHDFLEFIAGKMEICDLWKNSSDQEFENVKEGMEKLVMNRLFIHTFSPSTTDDAERDEVLSQKIRIFRWIKEEHLDIPHSPHNDSYLNNAQAELKKINGYKAPRDKVICILNCCKYIFTLIRRSEGNSKGADTFLPILIYVVLRSNPPNLVSNVQYISRFRNPDKLQAEAGYYLASVMGAISFIENLEASSLSISPEEFDQQIGKTMSELNQEKADALAAAETASRSPSPDPQSAGHRKQGSKLATLVAGTAATRSNRQQQPPINEKQYLAAESALQEKAPSKSSHSPTGSSILNPAALIERGANFATKTIQKPLDLIEKMFQDSGDHEDMAKPYPPRPSQQQYQQQNTDFPPPLPSRNNQQQQQQQQQLQRPSNTGRNDSFTEFVYVPAGQQVQQLSPQQLSPQQLNAMHHQQQQQHYQQGYPAEQAAQQQQQQPQPQYLQELEMLADMFPTCEREVCRVILQANDGRISPSIDTLLEISSVNDNNRGQQESKAVNHEQVETVNHEQVENNTNETVNKGV